MISLKPLFSYAASKRWTRRKLSELTGIPYITICRMRNDNTFTTRQIEAVCRELGLSIEQVMEYVESDSPSQQKGPES